MRMDDGVVGGGLGQRIYPASESSFLRGISPTGAPMAKAFSKPSSWIPPWMCSWGRVAKLTPAATTGALVKQGGWRKNHETKHEQKTFAVTDDARPKVAQGFDQLSWIHDEERSRIGEPLSWKIKFGSNRGRGMELAIGLGQLTLTHGLQSIMAGREAVALSQAVQEDGASKIFRKLRM
jgi:hypothetical protein